MKTPAQQAGHRHAEAFCHMTYESDDRTEKISIWNSRDGVTAFVITIPGTGKVGTHVNWHLDRYDPDYKPKEGDWIWVAFTEERAREVAKKRAQHYWDEFPAAREDYATMGDLVKDLEVQYLGDVRNGAPDLIQVGPA